jgi:hypothetical protein
MREPDDREVDEPGRDTCEVEAEHESHALDLAVSSGTKPIPTI